MVLQFFCAICHEEYGSSDEMFKIRCGHIFHRRCLMDWFSRSATCPDCRSASSSGDLKKMYITSRNIEYEELSETNIKLKSELEKNITNRSEIQHMLDESKKNISELQKQFDAVDLERQDLVRENQCLQKSRERVEKELEAENIENRQIPQDFENTEKNLKKNSDFSTKEQLAEKSRLIEELKRQLGEKSLELQKEVRNSTMLILEKAKLQQLVESSMARLPNISDTAQAFYDVCTRYNQNSKNNFRNFESQLNGFNTQPIFGPGGGHLNRFNTQPIFGPRGGAVTKKSHARLEKSLFILFQYAKELHKVGFKRVFYEGNKIFVKRNEISPTIQISSRDQVDDLFKKFSAVESSDLASKELAPGATAKDGETLASVEIACDDQFYAVSGT